MVNVSWNSFFSKQWFWNVQGGGSGPLWLKASIHGPTCHSKQPPNSWRKLALQPWLTHFWGQVFLPLDSQTMFVSIHRNVICIKQYQLKSALWKHLILLSWISIKTMVDLIGFSLDRQKAGATNADGNCSFIHSFNLSLISHNCSERCLSHTTGRPPPSWVDRLCVPVDTKARV